MKKLRFILPILLLAGAVSCEERFDLPSSGDGDRLYVKCYAGLADSSYIEVLKAVPLNGKSGGAAVLTGLSLRVDGIEADIIAAGENTFITGAKFPAGANVTLKAQAEGLEKVVASSRVPESFSFTTSATKVGNAFVDLVRLDLQLDREVAENENFSVEVYCHLHRETDDGNPPADNYFIEDIASVGKVIGTETDILSYLSGGDFRHQLLEIGGTHSCEFNYFSAEVFNNGAVSVYISPSYTDTTYTYNPNLYDDGGNLTEEDDTVTVVQTVEYQVILTELSTELYGKLNAEFNAESNMLAMLGLSPPNYAYTNISGGYGILATGLRVSGERLPYAKIR